MRKRKNNKKVILFILIFILVIICSIIIFKNLTKNKKIGNNMNSQEIVDSILNLNSYKAKVYVQVNSNKNQNKYILEQEYNSENGCVQNVIEPANIAGVKITKKDDTLSIENSELDLKTIFENYNGLESNCLDLISFTKQYKENDKSKIEENDSEIIMKTKSNKSNNYIENKVLYIDKKKALPTKLIIQDNNQSTTIVIEYIEVELH